MWPGTAARLSGRRSESFTTLLPLNFRIRLPRPWFQRYILNNVSFENPWSNFPGGDPFPQPFGSNVRSDVAWPLYGLVTAMDYDTPNMEVVQWNLSLQKQVGADWLLSGSYLGNHSIHLWSNQHINPAVFLGLGPCTLNGVQYSTCSKSKMASAERVHRQGS